ncbi:MAG TPA: MaoC family dehydratase [Solirubrobacteraceae bacterium]|jgi:acyl dehydratase|nr:MaoC family dehydratase [Solirubrobacteraceae bacterium]
MVVLEGVEGVKARVGEELGVSDWHEVSQVDVDAFAEVTNDHQWIHVDVQRAKDSQFGGTIAHGFYTLSLGPGLAAGIYSFGGFSFGLNYGLDRVRFPAPMPVGGRVRLRARLIEVADIEGGVQVKLTHSFEREGAEKPVCVAEALGRMYV